MCGADGGVVRFTVVVTNVTAPSTPVARLAPSVPDSASNTTGSVCADAQIGTDASKHTRSSALAEILI